ncbi:MAG: SPOR domain-containing protein [Methylococcales bacterium]|nr:SPOR domain-containing protein [Methylococcales bacterium]
MVKDYKHRISGKNALHRQDFDPVKNLSVWKWMLITASAISAVVLIVYLSGIGLKGVAPDEVVGVLPEPVEPPKTTTEPEIVKTAEPEVQATQFEFYTILPEKETIVPAYEIKTRTREERIGQAKATQYIMQVGSYNTTKDAEKMQAKLSAMGIEAHIQKAKVGNTVWYRIKIGPFAQIASVNTLSARLKQSGIDAIVTETDK